MSVRQGNKIIAGIPDVSGKANTSADNFSAVGKQNIITENNMDLSRYINITSSLSNQGSWWKVPFDGYVAFDSTAGSSQYVGLAMANDEKKNFLFRIPYAWMHNGGAIFEVKKDWWIENRKKESGVTIYGIAFWAKKGAK